MSSRTYCEHFLRLMSGSTCSMSPLFLDFGWSTVSHLIVLMHNLASYLMALITVQI